MSDLILSNANVITMDPACPEAQLIVIRNNRIIAVRKDNELKEFRRRHARIIDCDGKTLLPGFIDAHFHLRALAESYLTLNLEPRNNIRSVPDIQTEIGTLSRELPQGSWIRGRGYDEFHLAEKRHLNRWDLDPATSAHPIKLTHRTGQAHVLNSLALKIAGISKETPDPPEGLIERDIETGEPTGLLYRMGDLLSRRIPPIDNRQLDRGMELASKDLLSFGITSVQDASSHNGIEQWKMFERWKKKGLLKSRVTVMFGFEGFRDYPDQEFSTPLDENHLRPGGVKIIIDETTGRLCPEKEELKEIVLRIHQSGLQACLHAVEENAVEAACSAIGYALQNLPRPDHRHRIEHCSVCRPPLAKKIAELGIMVVTQPSFLFYSGERYLRTVPRNRLKHLYPIATLIKNGITVAGSSDCPVARPNPLVGIYSAVSRRADTGETLLPGEKISPAEALRMYGENGARSAFEETRKGSISPGKLADLVVLSGDPTRSPTDEIKDLEVEMTILDGEIVWEKAG